MTHPVTLDARFRTTAEQLELEYTATNHSSEAVFLINVAVRVDARGATVAPALPHVELAPRGRVVLRSSLRPISRDVSHAAPPRPYASRLEPGASMRYSLSMALPLAPEGPPPSREVRVSVFERVAFVLGAVPTSAVPAAYKEEIGGVEVWRLPAGAVRHQVELRAEANVPNLRVLVERAP